MYLLLEKYTPNHKTLLEKIVTGELPEALTIMEVALLICDSSGNFDIYDKNYFDDLFDPNGFFELERHYEALMNAIRKGDLKVIGVTNSTSQPRITRENFILFLEKIGEWPLMPEEELLSVWLHENNDNGAQLEVISISNPVKNNTKKNRKNELHELIWFLFKKSYNMLGKKPSADYVWRQLLNFWLYYNYNLIQDIDEDTIYWTSSYGNVQSMKFVTFKSTLSRLKKERLL